MVGLEPVDPTMTHPQDRFIVGTFRGNYGRTVILKDYRFWTEHQEELRQWCLEHGAVGQGMTVEMDEPTLLLFIMRWS